MADEMVENLVGSMAGLKVGWKVHRWVDLSDKQSVAQMETK